MSKDNKMLKNIKEFVKPFYIGESRKFHNWSHIKSAFDVWERLNTEQKIAWLFHDIVYLPGSNENEQQSANFMEKYINENYPEIDTYKIKNMILDTKSHIATSTDSIILMDIDMLSFSLPYGKFLELRKLAFSEYESFYGVAKTAKGTIDFCNEFLNKDKIFVSKDFDYLNERAKRNLNSYLIYLKTTY